MTDYTDADYINICNEVRDSAEDVGEDWVAEAAESCLKAIGKYNWKELVKSDLATVMEVYHEMSEIRVNEYTIEIKEDDEGWIFATAKEMNGENLISKGKYYTERALLKDMNTIPIDDFWSVLA